MESWSAPTLPEKMPRLKLPTFTGRPRTRLSFDSISGRKLLTFTSNGTAMATTINAATTIPATLRAVFTIPPEGGDLTRNEVGGDHRQSIKTRVVGRQSLVVRDSLVLPMTNG